MEVRIRLNDLGEFLMRLEKKPSTLTISSKIPFLKTVFVTLLVEETISRGLEVTYIDLDLQFSSLVYNSTSPHLHSDSLTLIRPDESSLEEELLSFISQTNHSDRGILFLDSINTFQQMFTALDPDRDPMKANRKAAVHITLLQQFAHTHSKSLFLTSFSRARPKKLESGKTKWDMEIVGGRMILFKSNLLVTLSESSSQNGEPAGVLDQNVFNATVSTLGEKEAAGRSYRFAVPSFL